MVKNDSTEQHASIITIDSNKDKPLKTRKKTLAIFEYTNERRKMLEIKSQLDSYAEKNSPKNESYNVIIGYYPLQVTAQKILKSMNTEYPDATLAEKSEAGYSIIVENFYKHTTAKTFSVMLKQNGYKNVKIEKHVVFGK